MKKPVDRGDVHRYDISVTDPDPALCFLYTSSAPFNVLIIKRSDGFISKAYLTLQFYRIFIDLSRDVPNR